MAKGDEGKRKEADRTRLRDFNTQAQTNYTNAYNQSQIDRSRIMTGYQTAGQEGRDQLNSAAAGYSNMANDGGFNADAVRARALAPTRAIFDRGRSELDRSRRLGGGSPNFAAAQAKMTRDRAYGLSDASVNAEGLITGMQQQGKMAGLSGLTNVGQANAGIDFNRLGGQANLYGSAPGDVGMLGNQTLGSYEVLQGQKGEPWWKKALQVAGTAAPYIAMAASSKELKEDIKPLDRTKALAGLKKLNLYKWKYKGDSVKHMGPMAEDFKEIFGVGDGKTLHLADVMGVTLAAAKGK